MLLAVDGSNTLHRAFHGAQCADAAGAAAVALGMIRKALLRWRPSHLVVALDRPEPTWRRLMDPVYKASRVTRGPSTAEMTDALVPLLDSVGICHAGVSGFEADDVLATLAARCAARGTGIMILTRDSDLLQCADRATILWPENGGETAVDATGTHARMGVWPHQITSLKAIAGDKGDDIPRLGAQRQTKAGARFYGFTDRRAAELVSAHGSLDGLYDALPGATLKDCEREWLVNGRERAYLNLTLAQLREDVPLDLDPRATALR
jgi:DNA polymerase-1